jgi:hypothetical protein
MKKSLSTLLIMIAAGSFFAAGNAAAEPRVLTEPMLNNISGESGIAVQLNGTPEGSEFLQAYSDRDTEVNREILRRNNITDYPVESTEQALTQFSTFQVGQASGKTFNDLIDEATPGQLPQFFIDEANRIVNP